MTGLWFSQGTPVSCTNKNDCHDATEILLKVVLNTIRKTNMERRNSSSQSLERVAATQFDVVLRWKNIVG
jgi:hypothetical protein